jgi:hypothetical protein
VRVSSDPRNSALERTEHRLAVAVTRRWQGQLSAITGRWSFVHIAAVRSARFPESRHWIGAIDFVARTAALKPELSVGVRWLRLAPGPEETVAEHDNGIAERRLPVRQPSPVSRPVSILIASIRCDNACRLHSCRLQPASVFSLRRLRTESRQSLVEHLKRLALVVRLWALKCCAHSHPGAY